MITVHKRNCHNCGNHAPLGFCKKNPDEPILIPPDQESLDCEDWVKVTKVVKGWDYRKGCLVCGSTEEDAVSSLKYGYDIYKCYICGTVYGIDEKEELVILEEGKKT